MVIYYRLCFLWRMRVDRDIIRLFITDIMICFRRYLANFLRIWVYCYFVMFVCLIGFSFKFLLFYCISGGRGFSKSLIFVFLTSLQTWWLGLVRYNSFSLRTISSAISSVVFGVSSVRFFIIRNCVSSRMQFVSRRLFGSGKS